MPMLSRMFQSLVLFLFLSAPAFAQTTFLDIRPFEGIGPLTLGMTMEEVQEELGEPDEAGSVNEVLADVHDLTKSLYVLARFDVEWRYTKPGAPFYKLLFNNGRLVSLMCTFVRMGNHKLALDGKALPPLKTEVVKELFGEPNEVKHLGKYDSMMFYKSPNGMAFSHAGPTQKPVGMLMYGQPTKQAQAQPTQAQPSKAQSPQAQSTSPLASLADFKQPCLDKGEVIDDPLEYVERYYLCEDLASVGDLALPGSIARLWKKAEDSGMIDQPFSVMGNDYEISGLSVVEHELKSFNPHAIEMTVRASFRNFGEPQTIDWVFQDDLNDDVPMKLIDIRGVSPHQYSLLQYLQEVSK